MATDFFSAFWPLWHAYEGARLREERKQQMRKEGGDLVAGEFRHVERMLDGRDWLLGGDAPTVADAYLFAVGRSRGSMAFKGHVTLDELAAMHGR